MATMADKILDKFSLPGDCPFAVDGARGSCMAPFGQLCLSTCKELRGMDLCYWGMDERNRLERTLLALASETGYNISVDNPGDLRMCTDALFGAVRFLTPFVMRAAFLVEETRLILSTDSESDVFWTSPEGFEAAISEVLGQLGLGDWKVEESGPIAGPARD